MSVQAKADRFEFMNLTQLKEECRRLQMFNDHNTVNQERVKVLLKAVIDIESVLKGRAWFKTSKIRRIVVGVLGHFREGTT